jgi:NAD(P)H dehydrogenase (quinone)
MIQGKVLVTGATGDTGGATVEELLSRGHRVRALAHRQDERSKQLQERGVEVVFGDLLDFGEMRGALEGVQRAYFCYPIRPGIVQATAQFAQAAKEAAVDGIVNMSQISAREDAKSHAATDHWLAERVFDWSGVTVAHIRPTYFAEWLLYLAPMIRAGLLHVPFGTGRHAPIVALDQARVIAGILEDPASHRGKIYPLYGPVEFTYQEIAQVLSRVLGKDIQYKQVSFETMLQMMASAAETHSASPKEPRFGLTAQPPGGEKPAAKHSARAMYGEFEQPQERRTGDSFLIQHLREVAIDHQNGVFAGTNDLVEKIGGRPPMTLEEFISKHHQAFE